MEKIDCESHKEIILLKIKEDVQFLLWTWHCARTDKLRKLIDDGIVALRIIINEIEDEAEGQ